MALVRELEDHGCTLRGSVVCRYIKGDVTRCVACEYKTATDEVRTQAAADHYIAEGLLEGYPIVVAEDASVCALCRGVKNPATTRAYAKITNKAMDVKRDLAGSGGSINGGELDIEAPACQPCLKRISMMRAVHYALIAAIVLIIGAGVFALNMVYPMDSGVASMFVFFGCAVAGVGMYIAFMRIFTAAIQRKTVLNVLDLPALRGFRQKGWYVRGANRMLPTLHSYPPAPLVDERMQDMNRRVEARKNAKKRQRMERMREQL
jgi:hypothetical protein